MTGARISNWQPFPDPRKLETLTAPFGPGCYEIRYRNTKVCCGRGGHVAQRMTSLLPVQLGSGTRKNSRKRNFIKSHLGEIEYRTFACKTVGELISLEARLRTTGNYLFPT